MSTLRAPNIIATASGKGGVGKTWVSITLAHLFARTGRNVLLFDGDIGLANVDVQLGLTPKQDLGAVFKQQCSLQEAVTHYEKGHFDILAGRSGSTSLANLGPERLKPVLQELVTLANSYDVVLIDLGAGIERHVQLMSSVASNIAVVVTDEPTSLTDAYAFIKLSLSRENPPKISIVINQAASQKEGEKTYTTIARACENFLKQKPELLGIIRKDNKVKDTIRKQSSLIETAPHTTAASDAAVISVKLLQGI